MRCCSITAKTVPPRPMAARAAPTISTLPVRGAGPSANLPVRTRVTASGTRLTANTQRQPKPSTSNPPSSGPITKAVPVHAVQIPMARDCAGPTNLAFSIASELGTRKAAPTPCTQRAAINTAPVGAAAHSSEAKPNATSPARSTLNRPKVSEIAPATRISAPSVSRYPSTTHCWVTSPPPRSAWMAGSARLTTEPSRKATKDASTAAATSRRSSRTATSRQSAAGAAPVSWLSACAAWIARWATRIAK